MGHLVDLGRTFNFNVGAFVFVFWGIAITQAMDSEESGFKAAGIMSLVGLVNIPIIKYSVNWWNTLHQPASLKVIEKSTVDWSMLIPLLIMIITAYGFFALLVILRTRNKILWHERKSRWVKAIMGGI